jgi:hypothetical protein
MSKMDNLRAMREAKYAAAQKRSASAPARPAARPPVAPPVAPPATAAKRAPEPGVETVFGTDSSATEQLCGHRNMSGRTCTREHGHAAKSHRYS